MMDDGLWMMVERLQSAFVIVASQVFLCRRIHFDFGLWNSIISAAISPVYVSMPEISMRNIIYLRDLRACLEWP